MPPLWHKHQSEKFQPWFSSSGKQPSGDSTPNDDDTKDGSNSQPSPELEIIQQLSQDSTESIIRATTAQQNFTGLIP